MVPDVSLGLCCCTGWLLNSQLGSRAGFPRLLVCFPDGISHHCGPWPGGSMSRGWHPALCGDGELTKVVAMPKRAKGLEPSATCRADSKP